MLTVNHVVGILLDAEGESWPDAFQRTLPTRKDPSVSVFRAAVLRTEDSRIRQQAPFAHISNSQPGESQKGASRDGKDPTFCRRDIQSISHISSRVERRKERSGRRRRRRSERQLTCFLLPPWSLLWHPRRSSNSSFWARPSRSSSRRAQAPSRPSNRKQGPRQ